jgi:hypothetical protein
MGRTAIIAQAHSHERGSYYPQLLRQDPNTPVTKTIPNRRPRQPKAGEETRQPIKGRRKRLYQLPASVHHGTSSA